jgi:hypothetical protein
MFRRRKLIDPEVAARQRAEAQEALRAAKDEKQKVQRSTSDIMGEVREHTKLLRDNNFAGRILKALGGAGG